MRSGALLALAALLAAALACSGSAPPPSPGVCGDGTRDPGEECDGASLGPYTCPSGAFVYCRPDCTLACSVCGNGVIETVPGGAGEACDGTDLGGATCAALGYAGGTLTCSADCATLVTTFCAR